MESASGPTVSNVFGAGEAARLITGLATPDGEFLIALNRDILENLGFGRAPSALGVQVRERVAPDTVSTKKSATHQRKFSLG